MYMYILNIFIYIHSIISIPKTSYEFKVMCLSIKVVKSGVVMVKLNCQINEQYHYYRNKLLGAYIREILDKVN